MNNPIVPTIEHNGFGLVVSSEQIAEGAGVQHKNVLESISTHTAKLERFGQVAFETRAGYNNSQVRVALLNEPQSTLLMTFMRNTDQVAEFKANLVEAFFKMAQQLSSAPRPAELTRSDLARMVLESESEKLALSSKIEADAPKVNFWDTYCSDDDKLSFRSVASVLKVGEQDLRECLIFTEWIYSESRSRWSDSKQKKEYRNRYSEFSHKKPYFDRVQNADVPRFGGELMHTLKITIPGAEAIQRHVAKFVDEYGSLHKAIPFLETRYNDKKAS
ncbi:Rha family transcriptional regulator [Glutamicibacter sp.]|uniref:Rha family transcriptional regulator n=1 Tax=Glutamicibacter sp. TaxID=1931995 RepID=UPI002B465524|nr:Rha family transcriptional regulator [Glutamicibacter sp.]HJX77315.1 Rha family transcriptional regulator [Glutamicibacter sp.]